MIACRGKNGLIRLDRDCRGWQAHTKQMYSEKSSIAVFCQLQVRYWMAAEASASFCLCKMALLSSASWEKLVARLDRTGPMRWPTTTPGPPNHCAREDEVAAISGSLWPLPVWTSFFSSW